MSSIVQNDTSEITFDMLDATTGDPVAGKTVTGQWAKPGGTLNACTGVFRGIGGGAYGYTPVAGDVDTLGDVIFIPTASGCKTIVRGTRVVQAGAAASAWTSTRAAKIDTIDTTTTAIAGYVDTEVAAIKAKTDNLPAAPAAVSDVPTAVAIADALLARNQKGGADGPPEESVSAALAGGFFLFSGGDTATITINNGDGTPAFTRTLSRDLTKLLGAIISASAA